MGLWAWVGSCFFVIFSAHAQSTSTLQRLATENPEVVITGNRQIQQNLQVPGLLTVITRQQIEDAGASTVNEAIMRLAGVIGTPSLYGGNEYALDLGGYGDTASSNTVVILDGVPLREADQSETRLSAIPVEQVERIEIYQGSGNVLYGEGASAGVIHVITQASAGRVQPQASGSLAVSKGSWGAQQVRSHVSKGFEALEVNASVVDARSAGYREHARHESSSGQLALKGLSESWRWGVNLAAEEVQARTPGSLTLAQFESNPRQAQPDSLTHDTRMKLKTERYAAFAETALAGMTWRADVAHRHRNFDAVSVLYGLRTPLTFETQSDYMSLSGRKQLLFDAGQSNFLVGLETTAWDQSRVYPTYPSWGTVLLDSRSRGFYVKSDTDFNAAGVRVSWGWREESFKRHQWFSGLQTSLNETPRAWDLGLSKLVNAQNAIYIRYAQSFRLPNLDEFTTPAYDLSFNPMNLRPQTDRTREIGWKRSAGTPNSIGSIGARLYSTQLSNEIIYDPAQYGNINLEATQRQGLDVHATVAPMPKLVLTASAGWRETQIEQGANAGKSMPLAAKQVASLRADWSPMAGHTLGWGWMYVGRQFISGDFANEHSMPSYTVMDMRYSYRIASWELSAVARNLADKKYFSYATTTGGYSVYPDSARSLLFTARYRF